MQINRVYVVGHIPDGKAFDWQSEDKPRQVTSRIVVGLSSIVYFFLLDGNVEDYQSRMMFKYPSPSTFIGDRTSPNSSRLRKFK